MKRRRPAQADERVEIARHDRAELAPEIEQVAVDHEVPGSVRHLGEESPERGLVLEGRSAEMGVMALWNSTRRTIGVGFSGPGIRSTMLS